MDMMCKYNTYYVSALLYVLYTIEHHFELFKKEKSKTEEEREIDPFSFNICIKTRFNSFLKYIKN